MKGNNTEDRENLYNYKATYSGIIGSHASSIKWLMVTIITFSISLLVIAYNSQFSNLNYAQMREDRNLKNDTAQLVLFNALAKKDTSLNNKCYNDTLRKGHVKPLIKDRCDRLEAKRKEFPVYLQDPLFKIPLDLPEYCLLLIAVSCLLTGWLRLLVQNIKATLIRLNNDSEFPPPAVADEVNSQLFLILPDKYSTRYYKFIEYTFVLLFTSILSISAILMYELFINHSDTYGGIPIADNPSHKVMRTWEYIYGGMLLFMSALSVYSFRSTTHDLKHVRNLLILIRWTRYGIIPAVKTIVSEKKNGILLPDKNLFEYRKFNSNDDERLVIYLEYEKNSNGHSTVDRQEERQLIIADISLADSIRKFFADYQFEKEPLVRYSKEYQRNLTFDENFMYDFFYAAFTKQGYEPNLYKRALFN